MVSLTVVILTKDEESNLPKCIRSFGQLPSRFVVVDSFSADSTLSVCASMREELNDLGIALDVYQHPFENHANQFNWALENTSINTDWIMRIDADEELTKALAEEIEKKLPNIRSTVHGINLKRRVYFMKKWIKHGGCYPVVLLRIFRTGKGRCEETLMDEHIVLTDGGEVENFSFDFCDHNVKSLEWWISKHNWYSDREVQDYLRRVSLENGPNGELEGQAKIKRVIKDSGYYRLPKFFRAHLYFVYRYYFRFGFLDGVEGKIFHFLQAYWYRFLVDAKIHESSHMKDSQ